MNGGLVMIEQVAGALGGAVLQSLWQGAVIGSIATLLVMMTRRATFRYAIWCAAMLGLFVWFVITFAVGMRQSSLVDGALIGVLLPTGDGVSHSGRVGFFEIVACLWLIGFVFVGLRFARQWFAARSIRFRGVEEADASLAVMFEELRGAFGVSRRVRVLVSEVAQSPMVVGWIMPVVVVPTSVIVMMSPEQVRLVLAHELAHIRRYDHLVNMLQVLVELVMFYHPVVWWMSRQARIEREHCCDDAAVRVAGDAVLFARALAELEEVRLRSRAVLGLHQGGSLMNRIERILNNHESRRGVGATAMLSVAILVAGTAYAYTSMQGEPVIDGTHQAVVVGVEMEPRAESNGELIEFLRRHVSSGALSREHALELYRRAVEESYERSMAQIESKVWAAVEAGQLSELDGAAKIDGEREGMAWEIEHRFLVDVFGMPAGEAKLNLLTKKLDADVAAGWLTREQAEAELEWMRQSLEEKVHQGVVIVEGVPILESVPVIVEGQPIVDGTQSQKIKLLLQREQDILDAMVDRGELEMDDAKAKYEGLLLKLQPVIEPEEGSEQAYVEIDVFVTPDGNPVTVEEKARLDLKANLMLEENERKLTPNDEAYWHHQGIRPLSAYEEESEDC